MIGPILGIESSCDETSVAAVAADGRILANHVASQVELHRPFRGVVPEVASRAHLARIEQLYHSCLAEAGIAPAGVAGVAATHGPGLASSLLVGLTFAKAVAATLERPLVGVHHVAAHFYSLVLDAVRQRVEPPSPPFLGLAVSGGHTLLAVVENWDAYRVIGGTLDDAAGEAFDKVASILGLPYPGGPAIDRVAASGDPGAIPIPRGLASRRDSLDFSFSGVKTHVLYRVRDTRPDTPDEIADYAASFQESVVESLVDRCRKALKRHRLGLLGVVGGVACNRRLRERLGTMADRLSIELRIPDPGLCTDNAAMIAGLGGWLLAARGPSPSTIDVVPDLSLPHRDDS